MTNEEAAAVLHRTGLTVASDGVFVSARESTCHVHYVHGALNYENKQVPMEIDGPVTAELLTALLVFLSDMPSVAAAYAALPKEYMP